MSISIQFHESLPHWKVFVTGVSDEKQALESYKTFATMVQLNIDPTKITAKNIGFNIFELEVNENG
jgi:hypothetical protein